METYKLSPEFLHSHYLQTMESYGFSVRLRLTYHPQALPAFSAMEGSRSPVHTLLGISSPPNRLLSASIWAGRWRSSRLIPDLYHEKTGGELKRGALSHAHLATRSRRELGVLRALLSALTPLDLGVK